MSDLNPKEQGLVSLLDHLCGLSNGSCRIHKVSLLQYKIDGRVPFRRILHPFILPSYVARISSARALVLRVQVRSFIFCAFAHFIINNSY